jgi:hypothetical protein
VKLIIWKRTITANMIDTPMGAAGHIMLMRSSL